MLLNLVSKGLDEITLSYHERSLTMKWVREMAHTSDCDNVHESLQATWVHVAEVSVLFKSLLLWNSTVLSQLHLRQVSLVLKHVLRAMT